MTGGCSGVKPAWMQRKEVTEMMTATLHFTLPEDKQEFDMACKAGEAYAALHSIGEAIRSHLKYGEPEQDRAKLEEIQREIADATYYVGY